MATEITRRDMSPGELRDAAARSRDANAVDGGAPIEIWFGDEARVGQQGTLTRAWAQRGSRPRAPLVLDGAGWHTSPELRVPDNISLLPLPRHSPAP